MVQQKHYLIAGGAISALISILHIILALKLIQYTFIDPVQEYVFTQIGVHSSNAKTIAAVALGFIFYIAAIYAFSGARVIGRLPLLRPVLFVIIMIYLFRAAFLPTEINEILRWGYPFRYVVFSTISLVTGLLYLIGSQKHR